jgi:hypothetical protein
MAQTSVKAIPRIDFNAAGLSPAWTPINTTGLPAACFTLMLYNNSNINIEVSYDGVDAHDFMYADTSLPLFAQLNSQPNAKEALWSKGMIIYVKATGAGIGTIRCSGYYV